MGAGIARQHGVLPDCDQRPSGLLLGMDTLVAQAFGARDARGLPPHSRQRHMARARRLAPLVALLIVASIPLIQRGRREPPRHAATRALHARAALGRCCRCCSLPRFRRYLQAVDIVKPMTFALVSANAVNFAGQLGADVRALGRAADGAGGLRLVHLDRRACTWRRCWLATIVWHERRSGKLLFRMSWRPDLARMRRLIGLGLSGGRTDRIRRRRLRYCDGAGGEARRGVAGGARDRGAGDRDHVHGAAGNQLGCRGARGPGGRAAKDPRGVAASGWAALAISALFMSTAGIALVDRARDGSCASSSAMPAVIARRRRAACGSPRSSSSSMDSRVGRTGALRGLGDTRVANVRPPGWLLGGRTAGGVRALLSATVGERRESGSG